MKSLFRPLIAAMSLCVVVCLLVGCSSEASDLDELTSSERVRRGVDYLQVFNFQSAYEVLSQVQPEMSKSDPDWQLATYSYAMAAWHKSPAGREAVALAVELLEAVVEHDSQSKWAASALLDLGRIEEISDYLGESTDVDAAQAYHERVRREFPGTEMAARATLFLAQSLAQSFDSEAVERAIELLEAEMAAQPESPWMGTMAQFSAQLRAFYDDDYLGALEPYERAMENGFPRAAEEDQSLWQFGLLAQEAGEDLLAARVFTRLVVNFPRSIYGTVARERIVEIAEAHPEAGLEVPPAPKVKLGR